jgi:hypothetical protein
LSQMSSLTGDHWISVPASSSIWLDPVSDRADDADGSHPWLICLRNRDVFPS